MIDTARKKIILSAPCSFSVVSAAGALEFAHEAGEGFDGGVLDGVIKRDAHAADGAVAGGADEAGSGRFGGELLFERLYVLGSFHVLGSGRPAGSSRHAEDYVHF